MGTDRVGEFEWEDTKAKENVRKHGVTFEEAMTVFLQRRRDTLNRLRRLPPLRGRALP
jgi:uncharacterized DUF497 family protein